MRMRDVLFFRPPTTPWWLYFWVVEAYRVVDVVESTTLQPPFDHQLYFSFPGVWRVWIDCLSLETTFTQRLQQLLPNVWNNSFATLKQHFSNVWNNYFPTFGNTIFQRLTKLLPNVWQYYYPTLDKTFVRRLKNAEKNKCSIYIDTSLCENYR